MLKAAVIGVGSMGRHHVRVYLQMPGVQLVAIADADETRREAISRQFRIPAYGCATELLARERPDLVSVAVPTALHLEVASAALESGAHVLVEKPIATTYEDGRTLIARAAETGRVLTVGHVERFNPAIVELQTRLAAGEIGRVFHVHARRLSPFPAYIHDVGVVLDLATHELDIMCHLLGCSVSRIAAEVGRNVHMTHEDMLSAMLRFDAGVLGVLDINWLTPVKVRELRITGECGMFVVDYVAQDLFFYENRIAPSRWDAMALFRGVEEGNVIKLRVAKVEPLEAELRAFVEAVQSAPPAPAGWPDGARAERNAGPEGSSQSPVSGLEGLRAVALATLLLDAAREGRSLNVAEETNRRGWYELAAPR